MGPFLISVGRLDIHGSGLVIVPDGDDAVFTLGNDQEALKFRIKFENDLENKESQIVFRQEDAKTGCLIATNFNNVLGTGTTKPIEIGRFKNRKLLLSFYVNAHGKDAATKILQYTWYLGEQV